MLVVGLHYFSLQVAEIAGNHYKLTELLSRHAAFGVREGRHILARDLEAGLKRGRSV